MRKGRGRVKEGVKGELERSRERGRKKNSVEPFWV